MTNSKKPREWWIEFSGNPTSDYGRDIRYVSGKEPEWLAPGDEAICVLEAAPVIAELKRLREALRNLLGEMFANHYDLSEETSSNKFMFEVTKQALAESEWVDTL